MTDDPRHHPGAATGMFDPFAALDGGLVQGFAPFGWFGEIGFAPPAAGPGATGVTTGLAATGVTTTTTGTATGSTTGGASAPTAAPSGGAFVINVTYDTSVSSADTSVSSATAAEQSGLQSAVNSAVSFMESMFSTNLTITIAVGWGEVGGSSLPTGAVAASSSTGTDLTYSALSSDLQSAYSAGGSSYQSQAGAALPGSNPTGSGQFYVPQAQEKALGVHLFGGGATPDGSIGLAALSNWNFGTTGTRAVAGQYDAIGAIEHEISEVMGRVGSLGSLFGSGIYTALDLFRYSGTGSLTPSSGSGSFSINGQHLTLPFNDPFTAGGDAGDWASTVAGDSFGYSSAGSAELVSATDLQEMNVLGWNLSSSGLTAAAGNCFAAGTRIATADGKAPVEALTPGTLVRTRAGRLAPIRRIRSWRAECRRHPETAPVRIAPHAFAPGAPSRALWLSPEHAVAVAGALIPIRLLVNGASIAVDRAIRRLTYFYLELDRHDLLLAEGLAAESFLDADAQVQREARSCLPLAIAPSAVEPAWARLAARSAALGLPVPTPAVTAAPALALRVAGRRVAPLALTADHAVFALPAEPGWLVSRRVVPAALAPWREDRRRLGVRVRALRWRSGGRAETIAADDPRLARGWWPAERDGATPWRWTDGAGRLPVAGGVLEVAFSPAPAYPADAGG